MGSSFRAQSLDANMLTVEIKMLLPSLANARLHWAARAKIVSHQRWLVAWHMLSAGAARNIHEPVRVVLTRVAPRYLDDDNLRFAFKAVRDEVTKRIGMFDDGDPRIEWMYAQAKGPAAVRIEIAMVR